MTDTLSSQVIVGTSPTKLVAKVPQGQQVLVANHDAANSIYVGGPGVTSVTGVEVKIGTFFSTGAIEFPPETELWAVTASGTARTDVFTIVGD